jgi:hypothetical protein
MEESRGNCLVCDVTFIWYLPQLIDLLTKRWRRRQVVVDFILISLQLAYTCTYILIEFPFLRQGRCLII